MRNKLLALFIGVSMVMGTALAADWYEATGNPAARSAMNSATLRTEFSSIQTDIADKLPVLTGNGGQVVVVNPGGTALTVNAAGIAVAGGGTGATSASGARTNLGLAIGTDIQAWDAGLSFMAALAMTDSYIMVGNGSAWVLESPVTARNSLGVTIGTNVQAWDAGLDQIAALGISDNNFLVVNGASWAAESGATARASLGVSIGSQVQAFDAELGEIAALTDADGSFMVGNGSAWVAESGTTVRDSLSLGTGDTPQWTSIEVGHATDSTLTRVSAGVLAVEGVTLATSGGSQPVDDELTEIAALLDTDGNIIVGNGSAWVAESGDTARISLGVGTTDNPQFTTPYVSAGIEVGHASDSTLTRLSAGVLQVEGVTLASASAGQPADDDLTEIAALIDSDGAFIVGDGAEWVAETDSTARASLGLTIGSDVQAYDATIMVDADIGSSVQAYDAGLGQIAALLDDNSNIIVGNGSAWVAESDATARTSLGLGTGSTVEFTGIELGHATDTSLVRAGAGVVTIEGSSILTASTGQLLDTELTEIAALSNETDGNIIVGTGTVWQAESGATARTSLGVGTADTPQWTAIEVGHASDTTLTRLSAGVLQVEGVTLASAAAGQPADDELTEIAALLDTDDNFIVGNGSAWVAENGATARASLGLTIDTDVQAWDTDLDTLSGLATTNSNFIVGNDAGTAWVAESGSTVRTSLGLGALAELASINNANWSGTELAIANGGTGATSAGAARTALGLQIDLNVQAYDSTILVDGDIDSSVQGYDADLAALEALAWNDGNFIVGNGSTWTTESADSARTSLGLVIDTDVQGYESTNIIAADLGSLGVLDTVNNDVWSGAALAVANGGTAATSAGDARSNLGLGTLAEQSTINNGDWSGTVLAVANGGTGSDNAADARAALNAQLEDADLATIAGLSKTENNFMVANGSIWTLASPSTARTALGLGTLALDSNIDNGDWSGTDLAIANGGTGAGTATAAASALGVGTEDSPRFTGINVNAASDTTITRKTAGELEVAGRAILAHDDTNYVSAHIIVTDTEPVDLTGMATGDIKLVY